MTQAPLVSVVMATHAGDRAEFLRAAIESVLAQTWPNLELLAVVDGPTSEANRAVLEEITRSDVRVRVLDLADNQGPATARNAGIDAAQGEYIAILDADDLALSERIERQVQHLEATGADVVGSWYGLVDDSGRTLAAKQMPVTPRSIRRLMPFLNPLANSTVLARAKVLKRHAYPVELRFAEDYHLWVSLALEGYVLANLPLVLSAFRAGNGFLGRRSGAAIFRADFAAKWRARRLYAPVWHPAVAVGALVTTLPRLLPHSLLACSYWVRNRLRFSPDAKRRL